MWHHIVSESDVWFVGFAVGYGLVIACHEFERTQNSSRIAILLLGEQSLPPKVHAAFSSPSVVAAVFVSIGVSVGE